MINLKLSIGRKQSTTTKQMTKELKDEWLARIAIYYIFGYSSLLLLIRHFYPIDELGIPIFGILNVVIAAYFVWKSRIGRHIDILFLLFTEILAFCVGTFYPGNMPYIASYITNTVLLFEVIPAMFIFRMSHDYENIIKWGAEIGIFVITVNTIARFIDITTTNYMAYANYCAIPWCFIVLYSWRNKKILYKILSVIFGMLLFCFSSRGGMLFIIAYLSYTVLLSSNKPRYRFLLFSVILLASFFIINHYPVIIEWVSNVSADVGLENKVLFRLNRGELFSDNARTYLWKTAWESIWLSPLIGYGVCGDCTMFGSSGLYVHNIFLELMLDYGVIIGGTLSLSFIGMGIYMLIECKDTARREVFMVIYIVAICQTMVSYSFYLNMAVFVSISLFLSFRNEKRAQLRHGYIKRYIG